MKPTMADAVAGRRRPRPRPPTDEEIAEARATLRQHFPSIVAPGMCVAAGCHEAYPCSPHRAATATLIRAGLLAP
ncbi:MAG: hypothetical protein ACRDTM_16320 [Micromonosporaceae bacterium]